MTKIELDINKLAGYTIVESDASRIGKLGSTKLGIKPNGAADDSADAPALSKADIPASRR